MIQQYDIARCCCKYNRSMSQGLGKLLLILIVGSCGNQKGLCSQEKRKFYDQSDALKFNPKSEGGMLSIIGSLAVVQQ